MPVTIDIDALLHEWATRMSATASLLAMTAAPDLDQAATAVSRLRARLVFELAPPRPEGWCPGFPPSPAAQEMRQAFVELAFREARRLLAQDDWLTGDELLAALTTLSFMERLALRRL